MSYELNSAIIAGRLTKDPNVKYTAGGNPTAMVRFTLAVNRGTNKADFIPCLLIGKLGEIAEKRLRKGSPAVLTGMIRTGSYVNKKGEKVYTTELLADAVTDEKNGNLNVNVAVIEGNLLRDPVVTTSADGTKIAKFSLGVQRPYMKRVDKTKDESDFISCSAFGRNAELVDEHLQMGSAVCVIGGIRTGSYKKQNGTTVYTTEVVADRIEFAKRKNTQAGAAPQQYQQAQQYQQPQQAQQAQQYQQPQQYTEPVGYNADAYSGGDTFDGFDGLPLDEELPFV